MEHTVLKPAASAHPSLNEATKMQIKAYLNEHYEPSKNGLKVNRAKLQEEISKKFDIIPSLEKSLQTVVGGAVCNLWGKDPENENQEIYVEKKGKDYVNLKRKDEPDEPKKSLKLKRPMKKSLKGNTDVKKMKRVVTIDKAEQGLELKKPRANVLELNEVCLANQCTTQAKNSDCKPQQPNGNYNELMIQNEIDKRLLSVRSEFEKRFEELKNQIVDETKQLENALEQKRMDSEKEIFENVRELLKFFVPKHPPPMKFDKKKLNIFHLLHLNPNEVLKNGEYRKLMRDRVVKLLELNHPAYFKLPEEFRDLTNTIRERAMFLSSLKEFLRSDELDDYIERLSASSTCRTCNQRVLSGSIESNEYDSDKRMQCMLFLENYKTIISNEN